MTIRFAAFWVIICCIVYGCNRPETQPSSAFIMPPANATGDSLMELAAELKTDPDFSVGRRKAFVHYINGLHFTKKGSYRQAQKAFVDGLQILKESPDSVLIAATYQSLGNAYKNLGEYPDALTWLTKALTYYEYISDATAQADVHADLAQTFQQQGDLPQATLHLNTAIHLLGSQKNSVTYLIILHTLANVYGMRNQLDSALLLDAEGLAITGKQGFREQASTFLDNKATVFTERKKFDSARILYHQCLAIDSIFGNKKQVSDSWLNLGILELKQHHTAKAIQNIERSMQLAEEAGYKQGQLGGWLTLTDVYKETNQLDKALDAQSNYYALKDNIQSGRKANAIAEWKAIFETERKEKEIRIQQALLQRKNLFITLLMVTLLLGMLAAYFANRRNKIRKEKAYRELLFKREQQAAADIISAEEKERHRIAADLHDSVGQILSAALLNLQAVNATPSLLSNDDTKLLHTAVKLINNGCTEIRQISHHMMPVILLKQGLEYALHEFIRTIYDKTLRINLSIDVPDLTLEKPVELMLYRVIQECVNNVVKHAQATRLDISINLEDQHLSILIEDNGKGMSTSSTIKSHGIGMQNIRSRINYLGGSVEWNSSENGGGTLVAVYVPVQQIAMKA